MLSYGVPFVWCVARQRILSHRYFLQTLQEATHGLDPRLSHGLYLASATLVETATSWHTVINHSHQNAQVTHVTKTLAGHAQGRPGRSCFM